MSDVHVDAAAWLIASDAATFASLPLPLAQRIFLALPADARGRACCVCRAWRDTLAEPSLWTRLDMSFAPELAACEIAFPSPRRARFLVLLHGATGRSRGQLQQLKFSKQYLTMNELQPVLTANAGSLREVHLCSLGGDNGLSDLTVETLVAAAPLLQLLACESVRCSVWQNAVRILRSEPQFALLQCRTLTVEFSESGGMGSVGPVAAALADAALHPALLRLCIQSADTAQPAVMGALVDALVARRLPELMLLACSRPAAAPLARLLAEGSLAIFEILFHDDAGTPLFDAAGAALVAGALRTNTTLTKLKLFRADLCVDMGAAVLLMGALVGHRSLRELQITGEGHTTVEAVRVFSAALAALIAADAPALHVLRCGDYSLGDAGLATIVEALPLNRHLRTLDVSNSGMTEACARERLLPAVRANTTLRELKCTHDMLRPTAAQAEAEELVRRRWQPD